MIDYDLLLSEAKKIGVDLGEYGADRFDTYAERLVRWNEHVNRSYSQQTLHTP